MIDYETLNGLALKYGTDKGSQCHDYMRTYAKLFGPIREEVSSVLEIGLCRRNWDGNRHIYPSLMVWHDYFPRATIHGADIRPFGSDNPRIRIHLTDQSKREDLKQLRDAIGSADVIIDDGSHVAGDQLLTLEILWPILAPRGIYVIEDLRCTRDVPKEKLVSTLFRQHIVNGTFPVKNCSAMGFEASKGKGADSLVWLRKVNTAMS